MSAPHPLLARRASGILLHVSSLPSAHGIGDLGAGARRFLDWLARAGQSFWQTLPVGPAGLGHSPYSATSTFAGEPLFIALDALVRDGLLPRSALRAPARLARGPARHDEARRFKMPRFLAAFLEFSERSGGRSAAYRAFERRSSAWLGDWCAFAAAREGGDPGFHAFLQFVFDAQWRALREYAHARGVRFIGDVPIFVGLDSADVAAHPELFRLRADGTPVVLTGVPPDSFSRTGQFWRQPHYRWPAHRRTRFRWWIERMRRALELFDLVRIDHFIGFRRAFEIPGGAKDARRGAWRPAPGAELLRALERALGPLPFIAEDLGAVTPDVWALRDEFGLPGMRIVQNAFDADGSRDLPCLHPVHCVAYPGAHDNETVTGWWRAAPPDVRRRFRSCAGAGDAPAEAMLRITLQSPAILAMFQLQDALGLPPATRMNRPGSPRGNWTWRADAAILSASSAGHIRELVRGAARDPGNAATRDRRRSAR